MLGKLSKELGWSVALTQFELQSWMLQVVEALELKSNDALVLDVKELCRKTLVIGKIKRLEGLHCIVHKG